MRIESCCFLPIARPVRRPVENIEALIAWCRQRLNRRCFYCGIRLHYGYFPRGPASPSGSVKHTVDHVVPLSKGGSPGKRNQVSACLLCNTAKGAMTLEEFRDARYAGKEIEFFGEREYLNFYEEVSRALRCKSNEQRH